MAGMQVLLNMMQQKKYLDRDFLVQIQEEARASSLAIPKGSQYSLHASFSSGMPGASLPFNLTKDNCMSIKDMVDSLDYIMYGKYFLCRTITPPGKLTCMHMIVDDPDGKLAVRLCLYNYTNIPGYDGEALEKLLPVGTILAVLNPFYKITADGGTAVRSDNPGDVVILEDNSHLLKGIEWKGEIPVKYQNRTIKKVAKSGVLNSAEQYKSAGNERFAKGDFQEALEMYELGLKLSPNHLDLLANRCIANVKLENFKGALTNANEVLNIDPGHLKTKYRKALAFIGLRKYQDALEFLENSVEELDASSNKSFYENIVSLKLRLKEQLSGVYDMLYIMKITNDPKIETFPLTAEYTSSSVKLVELGNQGRRGFVATADIRPGDLIMVSKAFVFHKCVNPYNVAMNINFGKWMITTAGNLELVRKATERLTLDPNLGKELYYLEAGPGLGYLDAQKGHRCDFVDMQRIEGIIELNTFRNNNLDNEFTEIESKFLAKGDSGLWIQPSFLNHSCSASNAFWKIKKDFMFIRAFKNIEAGNQVLISHQSAVVPFIERTKALKQFGVVCTCELCLLEKAEEQSVHERRQKIFAEEEKVPRKFPLSRQQLVTLKRCRSQLEKLRPSGKLNTSLVSVEAKLARNYFNTGAYLEAVKSYEKLYFLTLDLCPTTSLYAVEELVISYINAKNNEMALKWFPELLAQQKINYGAEKSLFKGRNLEILQTAGFEFSKAFVL